MSLFFIETIVVTKHIYIVEAPDQDIAEDLVLSGEFEEPFCSDCIAENLLSAGEIDEEIVPEIFYDENPLLREHPYFTPESIINRIYRYED